MPRNGSKEQSPLLSRSKVAGAAAIAFGIAEGCLSLSGTGADNMADAGSRQSDSGATYGTDAPQGASPGEDAAIAPDAGARDAATQANADDGSASSLDTGTQVPPDADHTGGDDAGQDDGGPFSTLVQVAITDFNTNAVATTATGGVALTAMDGHTLPTDGNDFATQSKVTSLGGDAGLPDDGVFPGSGMTIPPLQFGWTNAANNQNALLLASNAPTTSSFNVPAGRSLGYFHSLQIYATGTNGAQTVNYTLTYATGAATMGAVTVTDWCATTPLPSGTSKLLSAQRVLSTGAALSDADGFLCSIYAVDVPVDSSRVLTQLAFSDVGAVNSYVVLYGVAAW